MKIEQATITRLTITEVPRLDPVRVMLENYEPGKGRITIQCWGDAWTAYWGGMAGRSVEQFFVDCTNDYLIGNLCNWLMDTKFCGDALYKLAQKTIIERRGRKRTAAYFDIGGLEKDDARDLWGEVDAFCHIEGSDGCWNQSDLMERVFGADWHHWIGNKADVPNPKYQYMERICDAVRAGLREYVAGKAVPANAK